jgi:transcriptional regulator with XRE-family HTH domain
LATDTGCVLRYAGPVAKKMPPECPLVVGRGLPDNRKLGELIRRARGDAKVADLAQRVGVTPTYVRMLERGERAPSRRVATSLFAALGYDVTEKAERPDLILRRGDETVVLELKSGPERAAALHELLQDTANKVDMIMASPPLQPFAVRPNAPRLRYRPDVVAAPARQEVGRDVVFARLVRTLASMDEATLGLVLDFVEQRQPERAVGAVGHALEPPEFTVSRRPE